jgi:hypothetical protein
MVHAHLLGPVLLSVQASTGARLVIGAVIGVALLAAGLLWVRRGPRD